MKFVLAASNRYWWPVSVRIPDPNKPGKIIAQTLKIEFEPTGQDESLAAQEAYEKLRTARERTEHELAQLKRVCKGWEDVVDESGAPVPFNDTTFGAALQQSWFRTGVYAAYGDSLNGQEARLGN